MLHDTSYPLTDKENRPRMPGDLRPKNQYFKPIWEFLDDILAIATNGAVDYCRIIKWVFHEIKAPSIKKRVFSSKLDEMEANGVP